MTVRRASRTRPRDTHGSRHDSSSFGVIHFSADDVSRGVGAIFNFFSVVLFFPLTPFFHQKHKNIQDKNSYTICRNEMELGQISEDLFQNRQESDDSCDNETVE